MEIWMFVFGLIAGSLLCIILTHLSSKLDDIDEEYYEIHDNMERNEKKILYCNNKIDLTLSQKDMKLLFKMICKQQLRMLNKDSRLYTSDEYNNLELLKMKLSNLNIN